MKNKKEPITPLYDKILVERLAKEKKTASGIFIPDVAQEDTQLGTVIATGEGSVSSDGSITPLAVKKKDTVLFGKYAGTEVKFKGMTYLILKENEVLGVVSPTK